MARPWTLLFFMGLTTVVWAQEDPPATVEADATETAADAEEPQEGGLVDGREGPEALAFRGTVSRFVKRMNEFDQEARNIIQSRERQERNALERGYKGVVGELRSEEVALRDTAITRLERFLVRYPRSAHSAHAMFLLGDLYYEESEEAFTDESKAFDRMFTEDMDFSAAPEAPMRDHVRALRMFQGIVDQYPRYGNTDGSWYMLGYIYNRDEMLQADEDQSRDAYLNLVSQFPESEFAGAAHMELGEHFFDNHDIQKAIHHYGKVVSLHAPDGQHYEKGLYKLAWSYYKLSDYTQALDLLAKLLDWSEENFQRTGKRSAMAPEAVEYTSISFSDIADTSEDNPVDVAQRFYRSIGERDYEPKIYERLADVLTQQARYEEAILAYDHMIKRWPNEPKNPTYLWTIANLNTSLSVPDRESAQNAITRLNELFNRDSAWAHANRNDPDALAVADGYIEESLAAVAINLHNAANETGDSAKFSRAADLYSQYLNKFPFAKDYYEIQWYFADTLHKGARLPEAAAEYTQLLKGTGHPYRDGSMWNLMQVRRQILIDKYGKVEQLPQDAVEKERLVMDSGAERSVYFIGDEHKEFIAAAELLMNAEFTTEEFAESLEENRPALAYLPGQILYYHGHLEPARELLHEVIKRWPTRDEAAFSASLIVDSFQEEEDLAKVRMWAGKFSAMRLGQSEEALAKNLNFANLEEGAAFKMAFVYIEHGKREEAAEAFLEFMNDFPRSKHVKKAHYNAANNFEIIGQVSRANELFRDYVDRIERGNYEADDKAWPIYERIAFNYASSLRLDEAVRYFEMLYQRSSKAEKPYKNASAALYNAGFLRIGLGDHGGAARNLERYAIENRDQLDAEKVMFSAGDQWELIGAREARDFYKRYLEEWGDTNADHAIASYYRIAKIDEGLGERRVEDRWDDLLNAYNRMAATGEIGGMGMHYAAGAAFRPVLRSYEEFSSFVFTTNDQQNTNLLLEVKKPALAELEIQCVALIKTFQDFDYASAALYTLGAAYLDFGQMLFEVPEPEGLDEEQLDIYLTLLDDLRIPVEEKGKARLAAVLTKAKQEKRWSEWTSRTLDLLNKKFPTEYAPDRPEIRAMGDSTLVPVAGPMSARLPVGEEAPSPPTPEPEAPEAETPAPTEAQEAAGVWQ